MLVGIGTIAVVTIAVGLARVSPAGGVLLVIAPVVAGIWFGTFVLCGYGVTTPVVVLEDLTSSFDAFGRSWALTRGFKLKVLGLSLISLLLANTLPSLVLRSIGGAFASTLPALGFAITALGFALPLILTPVIAAVITLMYYDLRVRREAFDLQMLGEELGIV
jgi:predicted secreted protein